MKVGLGSNFMDKACVGCSESSEFKDTVLDQLGSTYNVAQFVSFAPGGGLRHVRICGFPRGFSFRSAEDACATLLNSAPSHSINVRSFAPGFVHCEFHYGLSSVEAAASIVRNLGDQGLYTIVNETIDINDGGISGVSVHGTVEFAPGDTPRCVERPGTATMQISEAKTLFKTVYGFQPDLDFRHDQRVEFSLHPLKQGLNEQHTVIWEVSKEEQLFPARACRWPNRFSRFLGDKTYGLLVASAFGLPVPRTTVISRNLAPFSFGAPTGTEEFWVRTCPVEQEPGRFSSQLGWRDPFQLVQAEDPEAISLASLLSQEAVRPIYSGAAIAGAGDHVIVEGVRGSGIQYMLGNSRPEDLPTTVSKSVHRLYGKAARFLGPVRFEWVNDGKQTWLVQLHSGNTNSSTVVIQPGDASETIQFETTRGIEELRSLLLSMHGKSYRLELIGDIGVASHMGDLLRKSRVPSIISSTESPKQLAMNFG